MNGDTLFEIGSVGKTFTAILLQDMIARGRMELDDPVAKYLPPSVRMPTRNGRQITLHHLATHSSGLPGIPDNLDSQRADNPYADYTVQKLYAFLSAYQLTREPGTQTEYSNLGMGLLGHAIALNAGADYESLVVDRICRPLKMDSTRIVLTPQLRARLAIGHNRFGEGVSNWDVPTLGGAGGLRSTANDLLRYVSANLGLTPSDLTPLMQKTHDLGLAWHIVDEPDARIVSHGGGTGGYRSFIGFDKTRRHGVVVLCNSAGGMGNLGESLLASEWRADHRPTAITKSGRLYEPCLGQYRRLPDNAQGMLGHLPNAIIYLLAVDCFAVSGVLLWRAGSFRRRTIVAGCAVVASGFLAALLAMKARTATGVQPQSNIGIRREGDRLFAQVTGIELPPNAELLPQSETRVFERLSGTSMTFSQKSPGKPISLIVRFRGKVLKYERFSDAPPQAPVPLKPRIAIRLDAKLLDACVGRFAFPPNARLPEGMEVTIWREGDQLLAQARGKNVMQGRFELYPESEAAFFDKITGARSNFVRNDKGEFTTLIIHGDQPPDWIGKKLRD